MRTVKLLVLLLALALLPRPAAAQRPLERLFYYTDSEEAWASLQRNIAQVSVLAPTGYSVDEDGVVWGEVDPRVLRLAREHRVPVMPLIVNPGFDQEMLHRLLASDGARRRAVASLVELCRRNGYWGIQFDFENVAMNDRDAFTRFFREAAQALHAAGFKLSAAVVHRPDELPGPTPYHKWLFKNWRAGYDLRALGEAGDFLSIMSYSQHTRRTPPGPQAGLPWQEEVARYFLRFVPPEKLSLGIPTGSQHWYTSQEDRITPEMARSYSQQVSHARALGLVERYGARLQWDEQQQVPFAYFPRGGTFEWIFLEDARSFRAKLGLVERLGLRGFSVWVLGPEDPGIWEVLRGR
ncbi:MAG TPA: glycosyl hydrolase family 18 protein [Longimicrobiaceae bacterium]|nr:glycosyl hydrolase family 18 protein [Longimicrobiaceae bacterium]